MPGIAELIDGLMVDEASPTLPGLPGFDLAAYRRDLVQRFRNPALRHRTWQIAMDGSQKLPQRLLNTIRDRIAANAPYARLALGVAAWMRYARGLDEAGQAIDVRDPLSARIAAATQPLKDAATIVDAYLGFSEVFGEDLPRNADFRGQVVDALETLLAKGSAATVAAFR